ncbi:MAG: type II toxin-antitoxin system VapC family toxin [Thermomicrobiales bacterium]
MIVDSSAIVAILRAESEADVFLAAIGDARQCHMSAATFVEAAIVLTSERGIYRDDFDELIADARMVIEPVTEAQAWIARQAYRDYGKGSGHRAQLNFGDCFSYALAKDRDEPLLSKGSDFIHTDIRAGG